MAPVVAANRRTAANRSAAGRPAAEPVELTVVGRQHRRRVTLPQQRQPLRPAPWRSPSARRRRRRPGTAHRRHASATSSTVAGAEPQPGTDHEGTEALQRRLSTSRPSPPSRARLADDLDRAGRRGCAVARGRQPHDPGCRRASPPTAANEAAPVMPGLPATTRTARVHLWASAGRGRHQPATSARSTACARADETSRPMSATVTVAGEAFAVADEEARLERGERHRRRRRRGRRRRRSPVSPSTPLGMSTASTGGRTDAAALSSRRGTRCRTRRR